LAYIKVSVCIYGLFNNKGEKILIPLFPPPYTVLLSNVLPLGTYRGIIIFISTNLILYELPRENEFRAFA
jgi:hypothetical protein